MLRKDIWDYLIEHYTEYAEYRDFLVAIKSLLKDGKLVNHEGIFTVYDGIYKDFWEKPPTPKDSSKAGSKENPFLSARMRNSLHDNPFYLPTQKGAKGSGKGNKSRNGGLSGGRQQTLE